MQIFIKTAKRKLVKTKIYFQIKIELKKKLNQIVFYFKLYNLKKKLSSSQNKNGSSCQLVYIVSYRTDLANMDS
jgi:hypothetical protein